MTTTTAVVRGPQPTASDLDTARDDLRQRLATGRDPYPYLLGVTDCLLQLIAEAHTTCRKPGCPICRCLRRATAIRIAYEESR